MNPRKKHQELCALRLQLNNFTTYLERLGSENNEYDILTINDSIEVIDKELSKLELVIEYNEDHSW